MKNSENLDKLFKNGYQQEYPFDAGLWTSMNKDLNTLHKPWWQNKRLVFILIFSLFSIGTIIAISLFPFNKETANNQKNTSLSTSELVSSNQNSESQTSAITNSDDSTIKYEDKNTTSHTQIRIPDLPKIGAEPRKSPVKTVSNSTSTAGEKSNKPTKSSKPKPTKSDDENRKVDKGRPPIQNPPVSPPNDDKQKSASPYPISNPKPVETEKSEETFTPLKFSDFWWYMKTKEAVSFNKFVEPNVEKIGIDKVHPIMLYGKFFTLQYEQLWAINGKKKIELGNEDKQYRSNSERFRKSFEQNLVLSLRKGNWSVATGIGVKNLQESISYSADVITENITEKEGELAVIAEEFIKDGKQIILLGYKKEYEYTYDTTQKSFYEGINKMSFIKVPIRLGYSKSFGRVELGVWGITEFMKIKNFDGQYVNSSTKSLFPDGDLPKSNAFNIEGGFGVKAGYFIKSNYGIGLSFHQKYMLNSTHKDLNQRFNTSYLGWYLNYNF